MHLKEKTKKRMWGGLNGVLGGWGDPVGVLGGWGGFGWEKLIYQGIFLSYQVL